MDLIGWICISLLLLSQVNELQNFHRKVRPRNLSKRTHWLLCPSALSLLAVPKSMHCFLVSKCHFEKCFLRQILWKHYFIWIHNGPPTGITSKNTSENIALFVEIVSKLKWRRADSTWRIFTEAMPSLWIQWNIAHKGSFLWKLRSYSLDLYLNVISKFRY